MNLLDHANENNQKQGKFLKAKIIPVFLPHQGCPNRCLFCNQQEVTGKPLIHSSDDIYHLIEQCLKTIRQGQGKKKAGFPKIVEVAFYGGNFTGLPRDKQRELLQPAYQARQEGKIDGIRISTRPDYICEADVLFLKEHGVRTIEFGVQSLDDKVLRKSGRYYSEKQVVEAVRLLHDYRFFIGLHVMIGLPEESRQTRDHMVKKIIELAPHFVRIHPTLVIKNTELERIYKQGEYKALTLEEAIELCKELSLKLVEAGICVARIGLQPIPNFEGSIMAGPFHPALGELVASSLAYDRMVKLLDKNHTQSKKGTILVPERELSIFIGQNRQNLLRLQQRYHDKTIAIIPDKQMEDGRLRYCIL